MFQRAWRGFARAVHRPNVPPPAVPATVVPLPQRLDVVSRERDAAVQVVELTHPICFLKGPRVTHRNLKMAVHSGSDIYISECIRKYGIWEPTETDFILDNIGQGDTFIDIGANIGYYSVIAADLVGNQGRVVAFEPDPRNFALLELNLAMNHAVHARAIQAAVSDNIGTAGLHRSADNLGDHRLMATTTAADVVDVDTVRLDPLLFRPAAGKVIVKIDTQGWEGRIILGNLDALSAADHLIFEWSPPWIDSTGMDPLEIIQALEAAGFRMTIICEVTKSLRPFGLQAARDVIGSLRNGSGGADDPIYLDIAASRTR